MGNLLDVGCARGWEREMCALVVDGGWRVNVGGVDKYRGMGIEWEVVSQCCCFRFLRICCCVMDFACVLFNMRYAIHEFYLSTY